jgi:hypothetical protein
VLVAEVQADGERGAGHEREQHRRAPRWGAVPPRPGPRAPRPRPRGRAPG